MILTRLAEVAAEPALPLLHRDSAYGLLLAVFLLNFRLCCLRIFCIHLPEIGEETRSETHQQDCSSGSEEQQQQGAPSSLCDGHWQAHGASAKLLCAIKYFTRKVICFPLLPGDGLVRPLPGKTARTNCLPVRIRVSRT